MILTRIRHKMPFCEPTVNIYLFLWSNLCFQHHYSSLQCHMIFRNHNNILIYCSRHISDYHQCCKQLCCTIFVWKLWPPSVNTEHQKLVAMVCCWITAHYRRSVTSWMQFFISSLFQTHPLLLHKLPLPANNSLSHLLSLNAYAISNISFFPRRA